MDLNITNSDLQDANHNMLIEILARIKVMQDMFVEAMVKETGIDKKELEKEIERKVYNNMKQLTDNIYKEYGHVDLKDIQP